MTLCSPPSNANSSHSKSTSLFWIFGQLQNVKGYLFTNLGDWLGATTLRVEVASLSSSSLALTQLLQRAIESAPGLTSLYKQLQAQNLHSSCSRKMGRLPPDSHMACGSLEYDAYDDEACSSHEGRAPLGRQAHPRAWVLPRTSPRARRRSRTKASLCVGTEPGTE